MENLSYFTPSAFNGFDHNRITDFISLTLKEIRILFFAVVSCNYWNTGFRHYFFWLAAVRYFTQYYVVLWHPLFETKSHKHLPFNSHTFNGARRRPDKYQVITVAVLSKRRVFRQKTIARVNGLTICLDGSIDNAVFEQIALRTWSRTNVNGLIGLTTIRSVQFVILHNDNQTPKWTQKFYHGHMHRIPVSIAVHGNCFDLQTTCGFDDPTRYLSSISN